MLKNSKQIKSEKITRKVIAVIPPAPKPTSVFAIVGNQTMQWMTSAKFFTTRELARGRLKEMAKERQYNLGVYHWKQDEDSFSFVFGWEEVGVSFRIVEVPLEG